MVKILSQFGESVSIIGIVGVYAASYFGECALS